MDTPPPPSAPHKRTVATVRLVQQRRTLLGPGVREAEEGLDHLLRRGTSLPVALRVVADEVALMLAMTILNPDADRDRDPAREHALAVLVVALRDEAELLDARGGACDRERP